MKSDYSVCNEADIASPALLLYSEAIDRNLQRMIAIAGGPERLRPHVKTHKLGLLVSRQIALGITRFKAATIAEAEMCAQTGAADVLLGFPPAGPCAERLCVLIRNYPDTRFAIIADHASAIRGLSAAARSGGTKIEVYLDLNVGMGRTGILPGMEAAELYRLIATTPGLIAAGLHAYDGHLHETDLVLRKQQCDEAFAPVVDLRCSLENAGFPVPSLIAGGTPTFPIHAAHVDRECSPGTTVLWDFGYAEKFPDLPFEIAAVLLARVVSKPGRNRLCLDLGHKAVAAENPLNNRVRFQEIPDSVAVSQSEEHLVIETPKAGDFVIGQALYAVPKHICPTVALHAEAILVREGYPCERLPIAARARRLSV